MSDEVVVSKKVSLSRNFADINMPSKLTKEKAEEVTNRVRKTLSKDYEIKGIRDFKKDELEELVNNNIISEDLITSYDISGFAINKSKNVSILINEDDHLKMQMFSQNMKTKDMYNELNKIDDLFIKNYKIAYDNDFGFLTRDLSKIGTGLKVSAMMFLSGIVSTNGITELTNYANRLGYNLKIANVDDTGRSYMFVLSNRHTLGLSEDQIIERFDKMVEKIVAQELEQRKKIKELNDVYFIDKLKRAYGELRNCEIINYDEAVRLIQKTKFAQILGFIKCRDFDVLKLINNVKNYSLDDKDKLLNVAIKRAKYIQSNL